MTDFTGLSEADVLHLLRLRRQDSALYESELTRLRSRATHEAQRVADERQRTSDEHNARRRLETAAPNLSADDHMAIRTVMLERGCDIFTAATIVGEQRAAATDKQ